MESLPHPSSLREGKWFRIRGRPRLVPESSSVFETKGTVESVSVEE